MNKRNCNHKEIITCPIKWCYTYSETKGEMNWHLKHKHFYGQDTILFKEGMKYTE